MTITKIKGAAGCGKCQKKTKSQNQPAPKTLKVSIPAIKGKKETQLQKQAAQDSSEDENCEDSIPALDVNPQIQPLPVDPSDDEDLMGSMDRQNVIEKTPTDTQRYRESQLAQARQKSLDPCRPQPLSPQRSKKGWAQGKGTSGTIKEVSKELDRVAHQTLNRWPDPGTSATWTATATEGPPEVEAMEVEAPPERPSPLWAPRPMSRRSSEQSSQEKTTEDAQGKNDDQ